MRQAYEPVTFSSEHVAELVEKLAEFRHTVNNQLALVSAAVELIRRRPELSVQVIEQLADPSDRIARAMALYSDDILAALRGGGTGAERPEVARGGSGNGG